MQAGNWPISREMQEYAVRFDKARQRRLLIVPALFDEGNKMRRLTVQLMRTLDRGGVDTILPDLPGMNESLASLAEQTLENWRAAIAAAEHAFAATHTLTIRGGALCKPDGPATRYAPLPGPTQLRDLLRARAIADREAGYSTTRDQLLTAGRAEGLLLAGYQIGPEMIRQLEAADIDFRDDDIRQRDIGGVGLWLRAEPSGDAAQAETLAQIVLERLR
ncbi:hypothetical protein [Aurantiacibacter aquimixticola]|uniref:Uncharacterized protein n=1 Tax=Aurantiacibacter aquimixticola TaxID=1958945 RepID=A0A419RS31_9SPHN|nr:hypothetical protein [Aurantiacibacter aquimixticola]RJY08612.1 hypothetical protein D6201_03865 [Aurantiacibacter aquimixticola]